MIDQKNIMRFVKAVERKKNFVPYADKVFRHMVSEIGELDNRIYKWEKRSLKKDDWKLRRAIGFECIDVIFLACYMADIFKVNLNSITKKRMKDIARQYNVKGVDFDE